MPLIRLTRDGNGSYVWRKIGKPIRLTRNGSGSYIWRNMGKWLRLTRDNLGSYVWRVVHSSGPAGPQIVTAPVMQNQLSSRDLFYSEDVLTLTRGSYTNTTTADNVQPSNVSYKMVIYKTTTTSVSVSPSSDLSSWSEAATTTVLGSGSTANTTITYNITDSDAKNVTWFTAAVLVNNNVSNPSSVAVPFQTRVVGENPQVILSRMFFEANSFTVNKTSTTASFTWNITGVADSSFLYQDLSGTASKVLITRTSVPNFSLDVPANITSLTGTAFTNQLSANVTDYNATLIIRGNDGWKTDNNFTKSNKGAVTTGLTFLSFSTPATEPRNTVAPTISPLNNRGRVPVNTTLTATQGTWLNTSGTTTYEYQWIYDDGNTPITTNWSTSNTLASIPTSYAANGSVTVKVRATNTDGGFGVTGLSPSVSPNSYLLDPLPTISNLTPTTVDAGASTNFSFTVSGYPTAYSIDWTNDGTIDFNQPSVASNTATVNASHSNTYSTTGTATLRIVAQPGNVVSTNTITITPASFTYSLYSQNTDLTPRTGLSQSRITGTNLVLFEYGSTMPAAIESDTLFIQGTASQAFASNTATVTAVTANGTKAFYTCSANHGYQPGGVVTVTGLTGTPNFNVTEATLDPLTSGNIFVINTTLNGSISSQSGTARGSANAVQSTVNNYASSGAFNSPTGPWEWVTGIATSASNSPLSFFVRSQGKIRYIYVNTSTTSGATSWTINAQWNIPSGSPIVRYYNLGSFTTSTSLTGNFTLTTNSMPVKIFEIEGTGNPTITVTGVTATGSGGTTKAGSSGTLQLLGVEKATATSATSSANYTAVQPPNAFTYTLSNASTVTAPSVSQTRQAPTSNNVLVEIASTKPSDTLDYSLTISGAGTSSPVTNQSIVNLNQFTNNADWSTSIALTANNSPITTSVVANGTTRSYNVNVSNTTNASSWLINFQYYGAGANTVTTYNNGVGTANSGTGTLANPILVSVNTSTMPYKIADITGSNNPTVTITGVSAWSGANQTGVVTNGTAGATTSLTLNRPVSSAASQTLNWTYANQNLITNPAYGTATRASAGWSATISTQPNPTGGTYSVVTQSAGTPTINSSTGALSVTGLTAGQSSTVTVRYSLAGYNNYDFTASGQALSNLITNPVYGTPTAAVGGWSATISTQPNPTGGTYSFVSASVGSATVNSTTGAVTASSLSNGQSSTVTVRYSGVSGYNSYDFTVTGTARSAPSGGVVGTPTRTGGSAAGRVGAVYTVNITTEATGTGTLTKSYQWQSFSNLTSTWSPIAGATGTTYTLKYQEGTVDMPGRRIRCSVTWTDSASLSFTPSDANIGEFTMDLPTITNVVSFYYSTASRTATKANGYPTRPPITGGTFFVVWYAEGYNMQGMNSRTVIGTTSTNGVVQTGTTASDSLNIYSFSQTIGDGTSYSGGIYRNTGAGGNGQWYALRLQPSSRPQGQGSIGQAKLTNTVQNSAGNQSGSPVTNTLTDITSTQFSS